MKTGKKKNTNKLITDSENIDDIKNHVLKTPNLNLNKNENMKNILNEEKNDIERIKEVMDKSKILKIEIISSSIEPKGNCLIINPLGLTTSQREEKDGITFFGYEKNKNTNSIDYIIEPKGDKCDERFYGKHFQIKFNYLDLNYYIKDLGHGFGTFIKIINWIEIKNNYLLNIGENYIVFTIGLEDEILLSENYSNNNKENYEKMLNVKIFSGDIKHGIVSFFPEKSPITIGRSSDCEILIDDNMLSRVHCTIEFKNDKWYIIDGVINEDGNIKNSTNGTWIYAFEDTLIKDKMTFKANHNLFICSLIDKDEA